MTEVTNSRERTVPLPTPIVRGETEIKTLMLRKPKARELGGIKISEILQSDVDSILRILPRISNPALAQHEVDNLEPENLVAISGELIVFFMTAEQKAELQATQQS